MKFEKLCHRKLVPIHWLHMHLFFLLILVNHYLLSGLERSAFDNKTVSFEEHCKQEHNVWHYLYFIVLIKVKDPTEFTGPESYVSSMIKVRKFYCLDPFNFVYLESEFLICLHLALHIQETITLCH